MQYKSNRSLFLTFFLISSCALSFPSIAGLSNDVIKSMDEANTCKKIAIHYVYMECMQQNNKRIVRFIKTKSSQVSSKMKNSRKQALLSNLTKKMDFDYANCGREKTMFNDVTRGEKRFEYCVYENRLETLINLNKRPEVYLQ